MIEKNFKEVLKEAKKYHQNGDLISAISTYLKIINIKENDPEVNFYLGTAYLQSGAFENSIKYLKKSLEGETSNPMIYNNLGIAFKEVFEFEMAKEYFNKALKIKKDFTQVYNNQGIIFRKLKDFDKSLQFLKKAIELKPDYSEAFNNTGNTFNDIGNKEEAIRNYKKAIQLRPNYLDAYLNIGTCYQELKNYDEAKKNYLKVREIDPNYDFINGKILHLNMNICNWETFDDEKIIIESSITNSSITDPFLFLSVSDDPEVHRKISENYIKKNYNKYSNTIIKTKNKIPKIGYFSPDFSNHPVLHLMQDTFKNHDKNNFEIYAFSFGLKTRNESHYKIKKYFKKFNYIDNISDKNVANLCREIGIDIAVDLCGHTAENRMGLFAERVGKNQINYLGYPGTTGAQFMDYILTDKYIIPEKEQKNYTEKVLYLPNCYQSNPTNDLVSKRNYSKSDFNLPENKFIYCSFNNHNKITPQIFLSWMKILKKVKNSVLWLYITNKLAKKNIIHEANKVKISEDRIIFASSIEHSEHLKRLNLADLFLDTFPYNAHTTGSDAFRMGLPMITLKGKSFASRVLASILNANELGELVTENVKDYENLAINLGSNYNVYQNLRKKVKEKSIKSALFNNIKFTKDLEDIYSDILKS